MESLFIGVCVMLVSPGFVLDSELLFETDELSGLAEELFEEDEYEFEFVRSEQMPLSSSLTLEETIDGLIGVVASPWLTLIFCCSTFFNDFNVKKKFHH
jgi:hypothetical protein